ncbi:MAG: FkbM family methyltransferase [Planctomycetota bacterium]|jgi:FkbM family methyltransferase
MEQTQIEPIRGATLLRVVNRVLPLGRHWHWILRLCNRPGRLVEFRYVGYRFVLPSAWTKRITTYLLASEKHHEDFFAVAPLLESLEEGTIVDVGANLGQTALLMRNHTALPLVVFEPAPHLFDLLRRNMELNPLGEVSLRPVACGSKEGTVEMTSMRNASILPSGGGIPVPVRRLDDELAEVGPIAFMKIDCEGYELEVLRGARQTLERDRPPLHIELHPRWLRRYGGTAAEVIEFLRPLYQLRFWTPYHRWPRSRLAQSFRKYRKLRPHVYADAEEMLEQADYPRADWKVFVEAEPRAATGDRSCSSS